MTTAYFRLFVAIGQLRQAAAIALLYNSYQSRPRNQGIAMDPEEHILEALFEGPQ